MSLQNPFSALAVAAQQLGERQLRAYLATLVNYNRYLGATDAEIRGLLNQLNWKEFNITPQQGVRMAFEAAKDKSLAAPFIAKIVQDQTQQGASLGKAWQKILPTLRQWGFKEFELVQLRDAIFNPNIPLEHYQQGYRFGAPPSSDPLLRTPIGKHLAQRMVQEGGDLTEVRPYYTTSRQQGISQAERQRELARNRAAAQAEREYYTQQLREGNLWEKWVAFVQGGLRGAQRGIASLITGTPMEELPPAGTLPGMLSPTAREIETMQGFGAGVARGVLGMLDPYGWATIAAAAPLAPIAGPLIGRLPPAAQRATAVAVPVAASTPAAVQALGEGDEGGALGALTFGALLGAPFAVRGLQLPRRTPRTLPTRPLALPPRPLALPPPETPPTARPVAPETPPTPPPTARPVAPETPPTPPPTARPVAPETPPTTTTRIPPPPTRTTRVIVSEQDIFTTQGRRWGMTFDETTQGYRIVDVDAQEVSTESFPANRISQAANDFIQGKISMTPAQVYVRPNIVIPPPPPVGVPTDQPTRPFIQRAQRLQNDIQLLESYLNRGGNPQTVQSALRRMQNLATQLQEELNQEIERIGTEAEQRGYDVDNPESLTLPDELAEAYEDIAQAQMLLDDFQSRFNRIYRQRPHEPTVLPAWQRNLIMYLRDQQQPPKELIQRLAQPLPEETQREVQRLSRRRNRMPLQELITQLENILPPLTPPAPAQPETPPTPPAPAQQRAQAPRARVPARPQPHPDIALTLSQIQQLVEAHTDATNRNFKRQLRNDIINKVNFITQTWENLHYRQQETTLENLPPLHREYLDKIREGTFIQEVLGDEENQHAARVRTGETVQQQPDARRDTGELDREPTSPPVPATPEQPTATGSGSTRGDDTQRDIPTGEGRIHARRRDRDSLLRPAAEPELQRTGHGTPEETGSGTGRESAPAVVDSGQMGRSTPPAERIYAHRDYQFTDADRAYFTQATERQKIDATLEAVRTLKELERTGRPATEEDQAKLARFAGWGAVWRILDPKQEAYQAEREELMQLLTPAEYEAARLATLNAHYTPPEVIVQLWNIALQLGLESNARVLEPAAGMGLMKAFAPIPAHWTFVEKDKITAAILKYLYPEERTYAMGYEQIEGGQGQYDLVISNVPFGNFGVSDPNYPYRLTRAIHDYFLIKSADMLRDGGLMIAITSRYTMDKQDPTARKALAQRGMKLIAAYRLPNKTFKGFAATEVITDILVFQKQDAPLAEPDYLETEEVPLDVGYFAGRGRRARYERATAHINRYYRRYSDHILGRETARGGMYSAGEYTVEGEFNPETLQKLIQRLPRNLYQPAEITQEIEHRQRGLQRGVPNRHFIERDDLLVWTPVEYKDPTTGETTFTLQPRPAQKQLTPIWRDYITLRDAFLAVLEADAKGEDATQLRQQLRQAYDTYKRKHGLLNPHNKRQPWEDDVDAPLVRRLEITNEKGETELHPIFEQPAVASKQIQVNTPEQALYASLSLTGRIDWEWMSEKLNQSPESLQNALQDIVIQNADGEWELMVEFLSGNIGQKYQRYSELAKQDPRWQRHADLLQQVLPDRIPIELIDVTLGATWIPNEIKENYLKYAFGADFTITLNERGLYEVSAKPNYYAQPALVRVNVKEATQIAEYALNDRPDLTVKEQGEINQAETERRRAIVRQLQNEFRNWLLRQSPQTLTELEEIYLYNYAAYRAVDYSDIADKLDWGALGMNPAIQLRPHQKRAILRILRQRGTLLDHEVGSGKTYTLVASAIIAKRMGIVRKPVIIVQKSTLNQFVAQARNLFPDARILYATEKDFERDNRRKFLAEAALGNWDLVILTHEQFKEIPISNETQQAWLQEQLEAERRFLESMEKIDFKELEKAIERLRRRLTTYTEKTATKRKFGVDFETIGFDMLLVDESQNWKGMPFYSVIPDAIYPVSEIGVDGYIKADIVRSIGGKIVFASGTPIVNKLAEMYIVVRAVDPQVWQRLGINTFEQWRITFSNTSEKIERRPTGEYKVVPRLNEYLNIPQLFTLYRQVADVFYIEDNPELKAQLPVLEDDNGRPTGKPIIVGVPPSDITRALARFFEDVIAGAKDYTERGAAVLKVYNWARQAIVDPRLVKIETSEQAESTDDPTFFAKVSISDDKILAIRAAIQSVGNDPNLKLRVAARKIAQLYHDTAPDKRTQLVFMDRGIPDSGDQFDAYNELKRRLVEQGVKKDEIAFIHDAKNDKQRAELFEKVNKGEIRILLGSTQKMGVGVNVQKRLIASHYLDVPWRPADLEQRDGRIRRQGNQFGRVRIYHYIQQESPLEEVFWTLVSNKQQFIRAARKGDIKTTRLKEIDDTFDYREVLAAVAVSPEAREYAQVLQELENAQRAYLAEAGKIAHHRAQLAQKRTLLEQLQDAAHEYNIELYNERQRQNLKNFIPKLRQLIQTTDFGKIAPANYHSGTFVNLDGTPKIRPYPTQMLRIEPAKTAKIDDETVEIYKGETDDELWIGISSPHLSIGASVKNKRLDQVVSRINRTLNELEQLLLAYERTVAEIDDLEANPPKENTELKTKIDTLTKRRMELETALRQQSGAAGIAGEGDIVPSLFGGLQILWEKIERAIQARRNPKIRIEKPARAHFGHYLRTPIGIYDVEGNPIGAPGYYETIGGDTGKRVSQAFVDAQEQLDREFHHDSRRIELITNALERAYKEHRQRGVNITREQLIDRFIDLIEKPFNDPQRQNIAQHGGALGEALRAHDELTEEWRQRIIAWRRALNIPTPDDWGITQQGYFRHLFAGEIEIRRIVRTTDGQGRTRTTEEFVAVAPNYVEALAKAHQHLQTNPDDELIIRIRRNLPLDPTLRVSTRQYFRIVGELADRTSLSHSEIMEDLRGVIGQARKKRKVLGFERRRQGYQGWLRDYERVMKLSAAQLARARALTNLKRAAQPAIEEWRRRGLYGIAEHVETHIDALWGATSKLERDISAALQSIPLIGDLLSPTPYLFRNLALRITRLQAWLKLEAQILGIPLVIRPAIVNLLDPLRTLFPYVSTRELARAYVKLLDPAVRRELHRLGVVDLRSGLKLQEGALLIQFEKGAPSWFRRASQINRAVGYLIGKQRALDKGLSEEQAHLNGLRWARRAEYDNSMWYCAPFLRSPFTRIIFQFKGYQQKAIEDLLWSFKRLPAQAFGGGGGRRGGGNTPPTAPDAPEPQSQRFIRIAKLLAAQTAVGGIKALLGFWGTLVGGFLIYLKLKESLKQEGFEEKDAETYARALYFGAPALLSVDLSASTTLWELPYGYTTEEKLVNILLGPTGTNALALTNKELTMIEKLKRTTPAARWIEVAPQLYEGKQRIRIGRSARTGIVSRQEAILYALGFQPVNRTIAIEQRELQKKRQSQVQ